MEGSARDTPIKIRGGGQNEYAVTWVLNKWGGLRWDAKKLRHGGHRQKVSETFRRGRKTQLLEKCKTRRSQWGDLWYGSNRGVFGKGWDLEFQSYHC